MKKIIKNCSSVIDGETKNTTKSNNVCTVICQTVVTEHCKSRCHFCGNMYLSYLRNMELFEVNIRTVVENEETPHGEIKCIPYNPVRLFGRKVRCQRCCRSGT